MKAVEMVLRGIKCDAPGCDYTDPTAEDPKAIQQDNTMQLSDREQVIALAEKLMGFVCSHQTNLGHYLPRDRSDVDAIAVWLPDPEEPKLMSVQHWNPLESISDAWMLQDRILQLGPKVRREFTQALNEIAWQSPSDCGGNGRDWAMIHATPRQRCLAALKAIESMEVRDGK
ncbi:MAG TPA: hypothetical protein VGM43_14515 [Bryobacteraceae bacterium]